jgi:predicted GNAT superfamily acetyltransferase
VLAAAALVADDRGGAGVVAFLIALGPGVDYASPNYRFFHDRYPSFRYVDRVVVDPAYARRGIGAALYDLLEDEATGDGVAVLTAEVNVRPPNETSLAFHAARGFAAVGEQDTGGGTRVRLLVRELPGG